MVEKGFTGTAWISETVIIPFIVLQIISALKNASMAGFIKAEELNKILDRIDNHKGVRKLKPYVEENTRKGIPLYNRNLCPVSLCFGRFLFS